MRNPHVDSIRQISLLDRLLHSTNIVDRKFLYFTKLGKRDFFDYGQLGMLMPHIFYRHNLSNIIAEVIGVTLSGTQIEIYLSKEEVLRGMQGLERLETPVAINVSGACSPNKNWPIDKWNALVRSANDVSFYQLGLPEEPLVEGVLDMRGLSLRDSFAKLKCAKAFIGVDSALAHAASGMNIPSVVLFGPTNPAVVGHPHTLEVHHKLRCWPCFDTLLSGPCPYGQRCMQMITADEVCEALRRALRLGLQNPSPL